jgi:hypothetical protein
MVAEGAGHVPHWPVERPAVDLAGLAQPVLVLPSGPVADYAVMAWSVEGWPEIANGSSSFEPVSVQGLREEAASFPDADSVEALDRRGIATVVIVRSRAIGSPYEAAADQPITCLPLDRQERGDAVIYRLTESVEESPGCTGAARARAERVNRDTR